MSTHNRTSRRRRIALGLGATGGGLLAAAFMPMGIALADTTGTAADAIAGAAASIGTGNFPFDNELSPDPFTDFTGLAGTQEGLLDQQINIDNPLLAAQIDYDIDNGKAFDFGPADGMTSMPVGYTGPDGTTPTTDLDPFEDAFLNNNNQLTTGALPDGMTYADAQSYDYALNQALTPTQVNGLDALADGGNTVTGVGVEPTTPDPFLDALQASGMTPAQITAETPSANYADALLDAQNPTYAAQLDRAVEATITADHGTLPAGVATDTNGFTDAFTNAGAPATLAATEGGTFDSSLSGVSGSIDPIVDTLGNPATLPDLDPAADFVQLFDPHAFTTVATTGLEVPNDFLGQLAVMDDTFLQAIGLAAPLDQFVDLFTGTATTTGTDALTGILGMFGL